MNKFSEIPHLPLLFKGLAVKSIHTEIKPVDEKVITVKDYNSHNVINSNHYKPISKIIAYESIQ
jgi:hypothetical protein